MRSDLHEMLQTIIQMACDQSICLGASTHTLVRNLVQRNIAGAAEVRVALNDLADQGEIVLAFGRGGHNTWHRPDCSRPQLVVMEG